MKKVALLLSMLLAPLNTWAEDAPGDVYIKDKQGCHLQLTDEDGAVRVFKWKGVCKSGYPDGRGTLMKYRDDKLVETETVTFKNKLREGISKSVYAEGGVMLRAEAAFEHGKLNGKMVAHLANGDVLELLYADGKDTQHASLNSKNGDRFEGELLGNGLVKGKWVYAQGGVYEGEKVGGAMHGQGVLIRKDGSKQAGEFILDEYVDIKDDTAVKLMPARFGLEFGMTRKQVEAVVGKMAESPNSLFRYAYDVEKYPDEKFAAPNLKVGLRTVYFDEDGKLWRVWAKILLDENTLFGGAEVMQAYGSIRRYLALNHAPAKSLEAYPHYGAGIESCRDAEAWAKSNAKSFETAEQAAPNMARAQRMIFDIGCGAAAPWERTYNSRDGKETYYVGIRYGNLYATPVIYTAAIAGEEAMRKKMMKTPPAPAASAVTAASPAPTESVGADGRKVVQK